MHSTRIARLVTRSFCAQAIAAETLLRDTCGIVVAETRYPKIDLTVFLYAGTDIESSRIMIVVTFDHLCIDWRKWVAFFEPAFNFGIWLPF